MNIENCIASNNNLNGVSVLALSSGKVIARVSDSTITDNAGNGLFNNGGSTAELLSRKNNTIEGNVSGNASGRISAYSAQ